VVSRPFCFPQSQHICLQKHFKHVFDHSSRIENRIVRVFYAPTSQPTGASAFIASKKVGNAVQRNRSKRVLKEFYRLNRHVFLKNVDIIFSAKKGLSDLPMAKVSHSLSALFSQHGLLP
jgi:ribonuclease P protein component